MKILVSNLTLAESTEQADECATVGQDLIKVHQSYLDTHEKSLYLLNNAGIFSPSENADHTSNPNSSNQGASAVIEPPTVQVSNGYSQLGFASDQAFQALLLEVRENPFFMGEMLHSISVSMDFHSFFQNNYDSFLVNMSMYYFHNLYTEAAFGDDQKLHLLRLVGVFLFNKK